MRFSFLILILSSSLLFSQSPDGKLYYFTGPGGVPPPYLGYINYPAADTFVVIDEIQLLDFVVDDKLFAGALSGVIIYDTANYLPIDTIEVSYPRNIAVWQGKLAVTSVANPHFRIYDLQSHTLILSLDTLKLPFEPSDLVVWNDMAFLLMGSSVVVVDLNLQDTIATVSTPHPFGFGGFNYFLVDAGNDLYIDVEYATGAIRFSLMRMDKLTLEVDTVFHHEGYANYSEPILANDKIYLGAFDSYYDITNDSLFISQNMFWPIVIDYDDLSESVFLNDNPGNVISYFRDSSFSGNVVVNGIVSKARFVPAVKDTPNAIIEKTLFEINILPNPASGVLHVILPDPARIMAIQLYEESGRMIECGTVVFSGNRGSLDCSNLGSGFYFVKILTQKETISSKFIKL